MKVNKLRINSFLYVILVLLLLITFCAVITSYSMASNQSTPMSSDEADIKVSSYRLGDNTGYYQDESSKVPKKSHPLNQNFIKLSVHTESDLAESKIDKGVISGYDAYGITGSSVAIKLGYNFGSVSNIRGESGRYYSISSDTAQSVGEFKNIGVVGKGALLFQKKTDPNSAWEWQTKDGESKKQLHTFNFTDLADPHTYNGDNKYTVYTPSGEDLSTGVFIKITFAYELKYDTKEMYKNFWGKWKEKTVTHYINMLETAEFYLVQNSGKVLFHNASNFDKIGDEDSSGAITVDDFETILSGDSTLNGFRLDTLGVDAYEITYRLNGGDIQKATDGEFFLTHGRYDFNVKRKIGADIRYTIFVDRREINDAIVGYFGDSLFTPDSKRIYSTGEYPTYLAGAATWNINATDGSTLPLVGNLYKLDGEGNEELVYTIAQSFGSDYKTKVLQGTINTSGMYKAEFWSNPKYLSDTPISGDLYHFIFRFEIVDKETSHEPTINEAYLNGLISFSDMQSKYYSVSMPTAGKGNAIFAFADYSGAYDFAYKIEREKVISKNGMYSYNGKQYSSQYELLTAVDKVANSSVAVRYFDASDPESYQTADIGEKTVTKLKFDKDIIVFSNDTEQSYMQAGLPSLNGRKYRYVSPDTNAIEEGTLYFSFIHVAEYESENVTLTHKETGATFDMLYGVSVESQLNMKGAPSGVYTIRETNSLGKTSEYDAVYTAPSDMNGSVTLSLYRNGNLIDKTFDKDNTNTEFNLNGFILKSAINDLDPYSIVKITKGGKTRVYSFDEASDIWFSDGGEYSFALIDRLGNTVEFKVVITNAVGFADISLQLEQPDNTIKTNFRAFVGQEITLPIPTLSSELFIFDGWLYNDTLITNYKFTPDKSGNLYIWQQITQKYTYLNFDTDGGEGLDRIKVAIGAEVELPIAVKDGWAFGGWEYGGNIYNGKFTPTSASPTFKAIWNYVSTSIYLYDGNIYDTISARAGDKVILPFPSRTGYTFFGWREELSDGSIKIYYGQITKLANAQTLRLDALWIRESNVDSDSLSGGTGGRTMIHFVDGALLPNDSLQSLAGATIATPSPTRAGYQFIGWVWRTSPIAGKIFTGGSMTVPSDTGNKIVLEALWQAKSTVNPQGVITGTLINGKDNNVGATNAMSACALVFSAFSACLFALYCALQSRKNKKLISVIADTTSNTGAKLNGQAITMAQNTIVRDSLDNAPSQSDNGISRKSKAATYAKYGVLTLFTALLLTVIISATCLFGDWVRLGSFQVIASEIESAETLSHNESTEIGASLDYNFSGSTEAVNMPTKDEVKEKFSEITNSVSGDVITDELDLTEEEAFIYSLVMLDLIALDYNVFPAKALLPNDEKVLGFAYTKHDEIYNLLENNEKVNYLSTGFIALPRQTKITESDIENKIKVYDEISSEKISNGQLPDYTYIMSYTESYGPCHYVANGKYVVYGITNTELNYTEVPESEASFNPDYGSVYNYDIGRIVYDPDLGKENKVNSTSINTLLDPALAKNEYDRYITEQNANGFTVDTMNFVYISYEALDAYLLSQQDETLLGIDVQDFYDMEHSVGPNEYYTVDADGNLTKLEFPPKEEDKASWLDRLAGAIVSLGMIVAGVLIVAAINLTTCGFLAAASPYIMGAFMGAGIETFMQTVIQGKKLDEVNWLRVGIAAVSGALAAIPGVGFLGAGLLQGVTEAALTAVDGGSLEEVLDAFALGFATGVVIHGAGKAIRALRRCFVAGTGVLMASGAIKAIENIRIGDMVKSFNPTTGKAENKRVLQTFENTTDELVTVFTSDGQQVTGTPGHKFYANNSWVSAEDLRAGDILVNVNGQKVVVEKIQHEILESPVKVYNFEVSGNHTYFVGDGGGIAVHNAACYLGKNKVTGKEYVGRTKRSVAKRIKEHAKNVKNPRDLIEVRYLDGLTVKESKILEQALIEHKKGIEFLDNTINGMSQSNPLYDSIGTVGKELKELFYKFGKWL